MAGQRRVLSAILFSPRGGSSHGARALSAGLFTEGWTTSLVAGSCGTGDPEHDAQQFYAGCNGLHVVDFADALKSPDPMLPGGSAAPMHPSFEDRPGAPDRVFASLDDAAYQRQVETWSAALHAAGASRADVLHLHHLTPLNAAAARVAPDVPVVVHLHGTELLMLEAIDGGLGRDWPHADEWADRLRAWAQQATRLVVATPGGRARVSQLLDVDDDDVDVVPNGVDATRFAPARTDRGEVWRRVLGDHPLGRTPGGVAGSWQAPTEAVEALRENVTFLYVGRFTEVKRVPLLIEAFANARERLGGGVSLVLVGGHPGEWEGEHPADAIRRLDAEDVLLAGWHPQQTLPELLRASDAVILPSVNESFGQVLVEGMACGLPAIAIDRGGPAEIIEDGETGWLVAPDDVFALETAIVEAARDGAERRRRGALAREDVLERYTWRAATLALSAVLEAAAMQQGGWVRGAPVAA